MLHTKNCWLLLIIEWVEAVGLYVNCTGLPKCWVPKFHSVVGSKLSFVVLHSPPFVAKSNLIGSLLLDVKSTFKLVKPTCKKIFILVGFVTNFNLHYTLSLVP